MVNEVESISYINVNNIDYPIDAISIGEKSVSDLQTMDGLVTSIDSSSDDEKIKGDADAPSSSDGPQNEDGPKTSDDNPTSDSQKESSDATDSDKASDDDSGCKLTVAVKGDKKLKVGDEFELEITVNNSLNEAKNVTIKDNVLAKNFDIVSSKATKGTYDEKSHQWTVGDMKSSESETLTLKLKAKKAGNFTYEAKAVTDSKNLNVDKSSANAKIEVSKEATTVKENTDKKDKTVKKSTKVKDKTKKVKKDKKPKNDKKDKKKDPIKNAGNPIMVLIIAACVVLGLTALKKQK